MGLVPDDVSGSVFLGTKNPLGADDVSIFWGFSKFSSFSFP